MYATRQCKPIHTQIRQRTCSRQGVLPVDVVVDVGGGVVVVGVRAVDIGSRVVVMLRL